MRTLRTLLIGTSLGLDKAKLLLLLDEAYAGDYQAKHG